MTAFSWFDPTTWPSSTLNQSILPGWSFMTVNEGNSSDPATEQRVVAGDSYGRQIGRMMDALEVLIAANPAIAHDPHIEAFETLRKRVDAAKAAGEPDRLARMAADLKALKEKDPKAFKALIDGVSN